MVSVSDVVNKLKSDETKSWLGQKYQEMNDFFLEPTDDSLTPLKIDIVGSETLSLSSDITDYYSEKNEFYNDQISVKPRIYTLEGEIGELVWYKKEESNSVVSAVVGKLTPIVSFLPPVSKKISNLQDKIMKGLGWVDSIDNILNRLNSVFNASDINFQQKEYRYLAALWKARIPLNIISPWQRLDNFVISNIEFSQPRNTKDKTLIKMTFKEFRTTKFKTTKINSKNIYGRLLDQKAELVDRGRTSGEKVLDMGQCNLPKDIQQCLIQR